MRIKLLLILALLSALPAWGQVKLNSETPLRKDKTQNSGSPTIQVLHFPVPKEIIRTFDIQSNSFYLMKGKILTLQQATDTLNHKTATLCQVNLSRTGVSALSLANDMNVKNVAYFSDTNRVQATIDVESESIINIVATRTISPKYMTKFLGLRDQAKKEVELKRVENFLKINASMLSDCFGTKVEIWEINKPN